MNIEPTKLPSQTIERLVKYFFRETFLERTATEIKLFPVKSSAPAITTKTRPAGNIKPAKYFASPISSILCAIILLPTAARAINRPAKKERSIVL